MQKANSNRQNQKAPVLSLRQVSFSYEDSYVLNDVSCDFYEGCIHIIAGPSGSGKSTLLQVLNGLIPHINGGRFEGRVLLHGEDITEMTARQRSMDIGLVMQDPEGQFCTFTVEEELSFGLENHGVPVREIDAKVHEVLEDIGLTDYADRQLTDMSGGQKQRIAIASIMAMDPSIMLLDEPTANLDPENRRKILSLIIKLARERGITIIMVEHNLEEIIDDIDRIIIMDVDGHIRADAGRDEAIKFIKSDHCNDIRRFLPRVLWTNENLHSVWDGRDIDHKTAPLIEIDGLEFAYPLKNGLFRKTYGPQILKDISLTINRGDFMVIAGKNGIGKTTLLNLIFRVAEQQAGTIKLEGIDIHKWKLSDLYGRMGLVFQNPELQFITNQVDEELLYSLKSNEAMSDIEKNDRVDAMLSQFHLSQYKKCSPYALSQGQKRRLSVATMLLTGQDILFLDEPTYGQDFENKRELMTDMLELNAHGVTIVFITHDEDLIKEYAQRVVYLEDGRVALDGSPDDYFRRYRDV